MRTKTRLALIAVAFLTGLLFLGWRAARDMGDRARCMNKLKQIGLALHCYQESYDYFPSAALPNEALPVERRLSWLVALWGFYEAGPVLEIDRTRAWDEGDNRRLKARYHDKLTGAVSEHELGTFALVRCPAQRTAGTMAKPSVTDYVGITGVDTDSPTLPLDHPRAGFFGYDRCARTADVKDGMSTTIAVAETAWRNGPWIAAGSATLRSVDRRQRPHVGPGRPFGGLHRGGALVLMVDGSVRFASQSADPRVLEALATIAGGEAVPSSER
ncbi:MAG: DUF1559 domain-containing protein [Isosphaeraceae bacterium]|nr:DUF1559 domain-containing protein [Isosphaeraceae bacterium]